MDVSLLEICSDILAECCKHVSQKSEEYTKPDDLKVHTKDEVRESGDSDQVDRWRAKICRLLSRMCEVGRRNRLELVEGVKYERVRDLVRCGDG